MTEKFKRTNSISTSQKAFYVFLFVYFGFRAIPQWFRPFSTQQFVWIISLPVIVLVLIGLGVRGFIGILQTKVGNKAPNPKHVHFAKISSIGLLWFVIAVAIANGTHYFYNHQQFSSEIWQDPKSTRYVSDELSTRQKMLDDVVENILPGSTQLEIEALLGPSTNTGYFAQSEPDLIYILGPERGFGVDYEWLLIWVDDSGDFERYEIVTD